LVSASNEMPPDVVGTLQFQFVDWHQRRRARAILDEMRELTKGLPGILLELREQESGPSSGKPTELAVSSMNPEDADRAVDIRIEQMQKLGGFVDIEDDRSLP